MGVSFPSWLFVVGKTSFEQLEVVQWDLVIQAGKSRSSRDQGWPNGPEDISPIRITLVV